MRIEIRTKKVVLSTGQLGREILAATAEGRETLPQEYLETVPRLVGRTDTYKQPWIVTAAGIPDFVVGHTLDEKRFQEGLEYARQCGERLARIRREHKAKAKSWSGEETFVI